MLDQARIRFSVFKTSAIAVSPFVAACLLLVRPAGAQELECETDADCGFGFQCQSETWYTGGADVTVTSTSGSGGFSGVGGVGVGGAGGGGDADTSVSSDGTAGYASSGGAELVCGDDVCVYGETWESCPDDCQRFTYCVGATCSDDSDCAAGYLCEVGSGSNGGSGTTGGGIGGGSSVCGDGFCDQSAGENPTSCADDCQQTCSLYYQLCNGDEECPSGYYCDLSQSVSTVGTSNSSGGEVYEQYDGACMLNGTSGGSGGAQGSGGSGGLDGGDGADGVAVASATSGSSTTGVNGSATSSGGSGVHHGWL